MGKGSSAANSQGNVKPFTPVEGPAAWYANDYKNDDSWIYRLTDGDIKEVEAALEVAKASGKEIKVRLIQCFVLWNTGTSNRLIHFRIFVHFCTFLYIFVSPYEISSQRLNF